jgi:hypothetical protein
VPIETATVDERSAPLETFGAARHLILASSCSCEPAGLLQFHLQ